MGENCVVVRLAEWRIATVAKKSKSASDFLVKSQTRYEGNLFKQRVKQNHT